MMRSIRVGVAAVALLSVGACGRGQEARTTPQSVAAQPAADRTDNQEQATTLLEMVPSDARHLARVRVAEAAAQPLFQSLITEFRQMPQVAQRADQIEQQCGEDPLRAVGELLVFDEERETLGRDTPRSAEMLVQLRRPATWALECLSSVRQDFAKTEVGGREARQLGPVVVVDAGNERLLVAHRDNVNEALERLDEPEPSPHGAVERVERLGNPLLFGTGAFANQMGMRSTETVISQEGDALELMVTGNMEDEQAADAAVQRLQRGLSLAEAFINRQAGATQGQAGAAEVQQHLRTLLDNVRIDRTEDRVRVALNLPDADTQRFVGSILARFLAVGGQQRLQQQPQQPGTQPGTQQPGTQQPGG